jgi:hypothetical protein
MSEIFFILIGILWALGTLMLYVLLRSEQAKYRRLDRYYHELQGRYDEICTSFTGEKSRALEYGKRNVDLHNENAELQKKVKSLLGQYGNVVRRLNEREGALRCILHDKPHRYGISLFGKDEFYVYVSYMQEHNGRKNYREHQVGIKLFRNEGDAQKLLALLEEGTR